MKIKKILPLLMCFDIGFEISEYMFYPSKIIILKRPIKNINIIYINSIDKLNFKQRFTSSCAISPRTPLFPL